MKSALLNGQTYYDGLAKKVAIEKYGTKLYKIIEREGIFERIGIWEQLKEIRNR